MAEFVLAHDNVLLEHSKEWPVAKAAPAHDSIPRHGRDKSVWGDHKFLHPEKV